MLCLFRLDDPLTEVIAGYDPDLPLKLMSKMGINNTNLERDNDGAPIWPKGLSGSISNIKKKAKFTAVSISRELRSLGIDIELLSRAETTFRCRSMFLKESISVTPQESLLCFSAKEALYKAVYPIIKKRFWFSAVTVSEISSDAIFLEPGDFLVSHGFSEPFRVEYRLLDEICFAMMKIA